MEQIFGSDTGYIGLYTLTEEITNDITLNSVLSEFIGSGEIWVKRNMGGTGKTNELLCVIFQNSVGMNPQWVRVDSGGTIKTSGSQSADWYMQAHPGDQFYRFKHQE